MFLYSVYVMETLEPDDSFNVLKLPILFAGVPVFCSAPADCFLNICTPAPMQLILAAPFSPLICSRLKHNGFFLLLETNLTNGS